MSKIPHIDTLKNYDELIEAGVPENQARTNVRLLNAAFDGAVTKKDLTILKNELKIFFGYIIIGFIAIEVIWPIIAKKYGLS